MNKRLGSIIGTLMRVLKFMLAVGFALSVFSIFARSHTFGASLEVLWSALSAVIFVGAFYGIHKRAPVMWKLGFLGIAVSFASFLIRSLLLVRSFSTTATNTRIESGFLVLATVAVAMYWSFWWNRRRSYFNGSLDKSR